MYGADTDLRVLGDVRRFEALDVIVGGLRRSQAVKRSTWSGLPNEERCGADQGTIVDLPHEEVRDIRTADRAESPVPWRRQDAVSTSCRAVFQKARSHDGPVEP